MCPVHVPTSVTSRGVSWNDRPFPKDRMDASSGSVYLASFSAMPSPCLCFFLRCKQRHLVLRGFIADWMFADRLDSMESYGVDAQQRKRQLFNCSKDSPELAPSGAPFAFFPRSSLGYSAGYPVFFPVQPHPPCRLPLVPLSFQLLLYTCMVY
jgi:hypothetical protein